MSGEVKKCSGCKEEKSSSEFYKCRSHKDGLGSGCKSCSRAYTIAYYSDNKDEIRAKGKVYRKNRVINHTKCEFKKCCECGEEKSSSEFHNNKGHKDNLSAKCKSCTKDYRRLYYSDNRDELLSYSKAWQKDNRDKRNSYLDKYNLDPLQKLRKTYSCEVRRGFKMVLLKKNRKSLDCLGCSWEEFLDHLQSQFYNRVETGEEMTFENHGMHSWHLDHIIPISIAKTEEDVIRLSHYTNFQPLWAEDNYAKGDKLLDNDEQIA
jgi:hypothetical protein